LPFPQSQRKVGDLSPAIQRKAAIALARAKEIVAVPIDAPHFGARRRYRRRGLRGLGPIRVDGTGGIDVWHARPGAGTGNARRQCCHQQRNRQRAALINGHSPDDPPISDKIVTVRVVPGNLVRAYQRTGCVLDRPFSSCRQDTMTRGRRSGQATRAETRRLDGRC